MSSITPANLFNDGSAQAALVDAIAECDALDQRARSALCKVFNCMARVYAIELIDAPAPRVPAVQVAIQQVKSLSDWLAGTHRDGDTPLL